MRISQKDRGYWVRSPMSLRTVLNKATLPRLNNLSKRLNAIQIKGIRETIGHMGLAGTLGSIIIGIIALIIIIAIIVFLVKIGIYIFIGLIVLAIIVGAGFWIYGKIKTRQHFLNLNRKKICYRAQAVLGLCWLSFFAAHRWFKSKVSEI